MNGILIQLREALDDQSSCFLSTFSSKQIGQYFRIEIGDEESSHQRLLSFGTSWKTCHKTERKLTPFYPLMNRPKRSAARCRPFYRVRQIKIQGEVL